MILCDIGNTYLHFKTPNGIFKISPEKLDRSFNDSQIFFISVSETNKEKFLNFYADAFDIADLIKINTSYRGMGVDRRAACVCIKDGLIVDAGSAITLDVMHNGVHLGGCILPGLFSYLLAYESISPVLRKGFNFSLNFEDFPQNTQDAMSFGVLGSIIEMIKKLAKEKKIYFTGGDGKYFSRFFDKSVYDEGLIFRGMEQSIRQGGILV